MSEIINKLANLILNSDISIMELSRKSGISRPMIYKIIKKEVTTISTDTINHICLALNKDPSILFSNNQEKEIKPNTIVVFGRGQGKIEYQVSEAELKAIQALLEARNNDPDEDNF